MHSEGKYNLVFLGVPFITVLLYALYASDVEFKYKLPSSQKDQIDANIPNLYMGRRTGGELINPSAWGHLIHSSYCDVGRFFYRAFKF